MTAEPKSRNAVATLRWGLLAFVLASLVHWLPRLGVGIADGPGDFTVGLLYGVAFGMMLLSLRMLRHRRG